MAIVETYCFSGDRYRADLEIYESKDGTRYVRTHAQDKRPEPNQEWSGHHKDMSEEEFAHFIYAALEKKIESERRTSEQQKEHTPCSGSPSKAKPTSSKSNPSPKKTDSPT